MMYLLVSMVIGLRSDVISSISAELQFEMTRAPVNPRAKLASHFDVVTYAKKA